jgi:hypothetical protein
MAIAITGVYNSDAFKTQCLPRPSYHQDEVQGHELDGIPSWLCRRGILTFCLPPEAVSSWQASKLPARGGLPRDSDLVIKIALTL